MSVLMRIIKYIFLKKGLEDMGDRKKNARAKSSVTVRDPHYTEFDTHKERNIQPLKPDDPSHP